ncbi:MAG: Uma2 family endonuclease [Candidatus Aminicenantes bacterium]|nr:Uma2 family endonuclease [Candidatus Aminicenantes bacterium]
MGLAMLKMEDFPHYTYDDYLEWEGRWELISGIPYAMVPAPAKKHQRVSLKIASQLDSLLDHCEKCVTYLPIDWQIDEFTVVQPDVLVVCGDNLDETKLSITPVLVFEILSPSTHRKDRVVKYRLYENAGVKYYCIVDPETRSADVFQLKSGDKEKKYREEGDFREGKMVFDLGSCSTAFDFGKIFER